MSDLHVAFDSKSFLRSHWDLEYRAPSSKDSRKRCLTAGESWAESGDIHRPGEPTAPARLLAI